MAASKKKKTAKNAAAKPPEVTAVAASTLGPNGQPPLDRPEWFIGSTSDKVIKDALKALCAPHKVPKSSYLDVTVDGTEIRLVTLPEYKSGAYEERKKLIAAWQSARAPLHSERKAKVLGGIFILPVPKNLKIPTDDVYGVGGWLRGISKALPLYIDPRGYIRIYTAKDEFPAGLSRGRTMWTVHHGIRLLLSTGKGKNEIWSQILEVARAP